MSAEENKDLVRRFLDRVMNKQDVSVIPEFMVLGFIFAGAFEGFVNNYIKTGFPDFQT